MLGPMDICVDLFAGGGGTSCGFKMAMGFDPDIAINHNPAAVAMHKLNHPNTRHYITDIWDVDPAEACGGRPVGMLWASPDCTHHSKARGKKPKDKKIRSLAWVVVRWAREVRPKVIFVENVEEFQTWGPLDGNGQPIKALAGETFRHFIASLRELGYCVEYRELAACDYGAPTTRNRFYLIARCDGDPIVWPEKTHGPGTGRPYHTAAECIDWTIPVRSIFGREKPLVENTLRRIAKGVVKYVLNNPHPFIVAGDLFGIASPHITKFRGGAVGQELTEPMPTITAGGKSERPAGSPHALGIVMPALVKQTWGEKPCQDVEDPLHTITTQHNKFALCAAFLAQYHTEQTGPEVRGQMLDVPLNVVDASPRYALCCANLLKHYSGVVGQKVDEPIGTVTAIDHHSLAACTLMRQFGTSSGADIEQPLGTVMPDGCGGKTGLVAAFLDKYYGREKTGAPVTEPMHTVVSKDKMSLVTVRIGEEEYVITDIGMRMLQPRELYRAQGFPEDYIIDFEYQGKPLPKSAQVQMVGNSVCPPVAAAIIGANCAARTKDKAA